MSITVPGMPQGLLEKISKQQHNEDKNKDKKSVGSVLKMERDSAQPQLYLGLPLEKGELVRKTIHSIKKTLYKGGLISAFNLVI